MGGVLGGHYCQSKEDTLVGGVLEGHCSMGGVLGGYFSRWCPRGTLFNGWCPR